MRDQLSHRISARTIGTAVLTVSLLGCMQASSDTVSTAVPIVLALIR